VVKLSQQGKIDLNKPLFQYIGKRAVENDSRSEAITAKMRLSHTSALPNAESKEKLKLYSTPGKFFKYSGYGYIYLQMVIEKITGKKLNALANEIVFRPLGMKDSSYLWRKEYKNIISSNYDKNMKKNVAGYEPVKAYSAWILYTTIGDYSKFVAHIIANSKQKNSVSHLLLEPRVDVANRVKWGMAWQLLSWQIVIMHARLSRR